MATGSAVSFYLRVCEQQFVVQCSDDETASLLKTVYGAMLQAAPSDAVSEFRLARQESGAGYMLVAGEESPLPLVDVDSLLFEFDKRLTIALQYRRPELFFIHGAVLGIDGRAVVLSAPSGTGKSTLAWAMTAAGFRYLSDELAPLDLMNLAVHPYPHAVCLKSRPPPPYRLPDQTLDAGRTLHVPVDALPQVAATESMPVAALFFLHRRTTMPHSVVSPLSVSATAAYLISNSLNSLAHPTVGVEPAIGLAKKIPGYALDTSDLGLACETVKRIVNR